VADRIGQQLGNYQLVQLLGEGSFAAVYLGGHVHLGTLAAIKVLRAQLTSEDTNTFRTEARVIAHLIHPNIVRVLDFGIEDTTPFLVMDFAPHGTLRQHYPRGTQLPLHAVVSNITAVADALQYAHEERLIHRDVKPENMLVGRRNEILLSDFGIATLVQSSSDRHSSDTAGTMVYMAPEQVQGKPCPASDQYSLGIVAYEWLCGTCPFLGSSSIEVAMKHMSEPPRPLRDVLPSISPAVEQVVLRALAKNPDDRFMNIQDFAVALKQASSSDYDHVVPQTSVQSGQLPSLGTPTALSSDNSFPTLP
jgi:eukaryotic-like serine/threonine-protein kinase